VPCLFSSMLSGSLAGTIVSPSQRTAAWKMADSQPKRPVQKRPKRPRIDIDEQIEEANRLAALLKKVQQSAKNIKKSGQRTKKRLLAKAGRLSGDDLERISVIKRCGLVVDPRAANGATSSTETRDPMKLSKDNTRKSITDALVGIFDGLVSTSRAVDEHVPEDPDEQMGGLASPSASTPNVSGVLRLASTARVGSVFAAALQLMNDNGTTATPGTGCQDVVGQGPHGELEEEINEVADDAAED
jgi:hypothetical protein